MPNFQFMDDFGGFDMSFVIGNMARYISPQEGSYIQMANVWWYQMLVIAIFQEHYLSSLIKLVTMSLLPH